MEKDFSELVEYLDGKFSNIDQKFGKIDQKFDKIDQRFFDIGSKIENLQETKADKDDINNLMDAVDSYAKKADAYFQEMVALTHKVDRHEKWLLQIADKLGLKLEY